ncbi:hypothetical protein JCM10213_008406 [Rhodosporidiobolus nylandii]
MLPLLPVELQLRVLELAVPPSSQHRTRVQRLSRLSLVCQSWRSHAQLLLLPSVRYVLPWRAYTHCTSRHFRNTDRRAEEYKQRRLRDRLAALKRMGVGVREIEVSLLLLLLPDRLVEGDELVRLIGEMCAGVHSVTVRYGPEGASSLERFLRLFPELKHLRLQSEALSDPATLPLSLFSSSPAPDSSLTLPSPLSNLTSLTLSRLALDSWPPPAPLPHLTSLTLTQGGGFNSSLGPSSATAMADLFAFTPNLRRFSWQGFRPLPSWATFERAPLSLREVVFWVESRGEAKACAAAIQGIIAGTELRQVIFRRLSGGVAWKRKGWEREVDQWGADRGAVVLWGDPPRHEDDDRFEDGYDEEDEEDAVRML